MFKIPGNLPGISEQRVSGSSLGEGGGGSIAAHVGYTPYLLIASWEMFSSSQMNVHLPYPSFSSPYLSSALASDSGALCAVTGEPAQLRRLSRCGRRQRLIENLMTAPAQTALLIMLRRQLPRRRHKDISFCDRYVSRGRDGTRPGYRHKFSFHIPYGNGRKALGSGHQ